jgi:hypothetical protein
MKMKMNKILVIFFMICCSVSLPCVHADEHECVSELEDKVKPCARQNFEYFVNQGKVLAGANSGCCKIYHEFYESCASKFIAFKADMLLFSWLKDSCAVPTATPSKPLPSPPIKPLPSPSKPLPSPPIKPLPSPPIGPTGPTPIFTFDGQTFPISTFEPPEIPLPKITFKGSLRGCMYGDGVSSRTWMNTFENTRKVFCGLRREKGIACDPGVEPYDTVAELCYIFYDPKKSSEKNKVVLVQPQFFVDSSDSSQP